MENLIFHEHPSLNKPILVAAFAGWPDAQDGASGAVRYLTRRLSAKKFAELDPEEFYVFTRVRPAVRINREGQRSIRWPSNNFYYLQDESVQKDLVFFVGVEPNLKWKAYTAAIMEVAHQCDADMVVVLGSLMDTTPHTREPRITGSATSPEMQQRFEELDIWGSGYQGPTSASSILMEACGKENLNFATLWGYSPHYLQASPNPKISYALLKRLTQILNLEVPLGELSDACVAFEAQVSKAISGNEEVSSYVRRLEERYDRAVERQAQEPQEELPPSDVVIKDLEDFLRQQQRGEEEGPEDVARGG